MKVGIDARLLTEPITGIGRYTYEICKNISRSDIILKVYTPSTIPTNVVNELGKSLVRSSNKFGRINRMIWSQTCLPRWASLDQIDVYWGPTHRIPENLSNKIARVVTIHDLVWKYASETMRPLSRFVESILMPRALKSSDLIVTVSESTAQGIINIYPFLKQKIRVIHLGISTFPKAGSIQDVSNQGIYSPFFLFVGTLEPRKNLQRLLEAYADLSHDLKNKYKFVIVGGKGWGGVNVGSLIEKYQLSDYVTVLGYVNDQLLATLYENASFLAMPSIYEGFGLPIVEAMSFGLPILTSNRSSMPEIAGDAGVLVDPYSVDSIREGLIKLINFENNLLNLSKRAKVLSKNFSWQKASNELVNVFSEAIEIRKSTYR
ncbi:glycosyltransferase family 4 protein [Ferrovum sp. PN-J185]|uniref:glycosyltransferase family 4 protein n=1 Tax=Ferrovum sp. PN-J185 TaxID=1356306 RepID=UPI001E4D6880|nr:glycosyltransferase family 1 protein [Ferrovum sp. PN-J185]MCC6068775.1 glycosyltransferase family 4 protein [Ferrovum sp. PN-J185]